MDQPSYFWEYNLKKKKTPYIGYIDENSCLILTAMAKSGNSLNIYQKGAY